MNTLIITVAFLVIGYFTGILRPTGLLSRTPSMLTGAQQLRIAKIGIPIAIALMIFWTFGYLIIWQRLQIEVEGTIVARQEFPQTPQTHGPTTVYKVQRSDGSLSQYTAAVGDDSLPQTMPVGARVAKQKWELSYSLNGQRVDFPLMFLVVFLTIGILCLISSTVVLVRGRKQGNHHFTNDIEEI